MQSKEPTARSCKSANLRICETRLLSPSQAIAAKWKKTFDRCEARRIVEPEIRESPSELSDQVGFRELSMLQDTLLQLLLNSE